MTEKILDFIQTHSIKGFLDHAEGCRLHELVRTLIGEWPVLEIGSYCGKSALYLGDACRESGNTVFSVDHHRGSEEHQQGQEYHDPDLYDETKKIFNSFPCFQRTIDLAGLKDIVVPVVASSELMVKYWRTPLGLVFVDGGHSLAQATHDCSAWSKHVVAGGYLVVHDLFDSPSDGGQAPLIAFNQVLNSGAWELLERTNTLGVLQKKHVN